MGVMGSPLRFNKKTRKRYRRLAKKAVMVADKFESERSKPNAVALLRRLAESDLARAKSRKKKKSKDPI
jgi:HD superfamily phosphohydrolase YqeK